MAGGSKYFTLSDFIIEGAGGSAGAAARDGTEAQVVQTRPNQVVQGG